jgi:SAM-dependent methyltransferase
MSIELSPPFRDLNFLAPMSEQRADRMVAFLAPSLHGTVVDVGCGWAELLLRVVAAAPGCHGTGIDLDAEALGHGRELAAERYLTDRVALVEGDATAVAPSHADAAICIGASHAWKPPGDDYEPMGYARALAALHARVPRGARVLYGEAIWSAPPTRAAADALSGHLDELLLLPDLVDTAAEAGFMPMAVEEATTAEWDAFESGFNACYPRWLTTHEPDHPDADEVHSRAAQQRRNYLRGYRGTMGMAYLHLVAT